MPDLFGTPEGSIAAQKQMQDSAVFNLTMQDETNKVAMSGIQLQQQEKMLQMLNQKAMGKPGQPSGNASVADAVNEMYSMAQMYEATGQLDKAGLLFSRASTMQKNMGDIESKRLTDSLKKFNTMSGMMEGVTDQASWQRANAMYELETGEKSPYADLPYNPQVVDKIRQGIESKKDQALRLAADARARDSDAAANEHRARLPLIKAQTRAADARTEAIKKAGGKELLPNALDISLVTQELAANYGADPTNPETKLVAATIAEEKKELQVREGLSPSVAAKRAVLNAQRRGDLRGLTKDFGTVNRPKPLPAKAADREVNTWYNTPLGKGLWTGKNFLRPEEVEGAKDEGKIVEGEEDEEEADE